MYSFTILTPCKSDFRFLKIFQDSTLKSERFVKGTYFCTFVQGVFCYHVSSQTEKSPKSQSQNSYL